MLIRIFMWWFRLKGWKIEGGIPQDVRKCVLLAAPHTSNWDFVYGMGALGLFRYKVKYLAKAELFRGFFGRLFYATGGIPVDRSKPNALVSSVTELLAKMDELVVLFPPEATRKPVSKWKTGFYYTAVGAGLPIAPGYLDYERRVAGIGPLIHPTGDIAEDFKKIRAFYSDKKGRIPSNFRLPEIPEPR